MAQTNLPYILKILDEKFKVLNLTEIYSLCIIWGGALVFNVTFNNISVISCIIWLESVRNNHVYA
jgi:hypothetical protein